MSLASTSSVQLSYIEESVPGQTPGTGTPKNLRFTGESLAYDIRSEISKEINSSRQVTDSVHIGASAQGDLNFEFHYREYDPFLESILAGTFSTAFGTDGVAAMTVSFDTGANTITDDGIDGFAGLVAGQWISVGGSSGNDGVYRIETMTDDVLTLDTDTPLKATAAGVSCNISSSRLAMGTAGLRYFSLQKQFADVGQFFMFRGMSPSKFDLNFETESFLGGSVGFLGFNSVRDTATMMPGAADPATSFGAMNSVSGLGTILLDNAPIAGTYIKSAKLSIDPKLRNQTAIGSLGAVGVGTGTFMIGGSLEMYLADGAIYDQALANTSVSLQLHTKDVNNNGYAFIMSNVKLRVPQVLAGSMDSDVMLAVDYDCTAPDTVNDKMLIVDRYGQALA